MTPKPDKDITRKENYRPNITDECIHKNPQRNTISSGIQQHMKRIIYHDQAGFIPGMQGFFNICKSFSVINHINKLKNKNYVFISIDAEELLKKFNTLL